MNIDGFNELYHFRLVRRGTQEVGNSAIVGPMLHVSDDDGEGLRRSVMVIGRQRQETQERGDIESDAAIFIIEGCGGELTNILCAGATRLRARTAAAALSGAIGRVVEWRHGNEAFAGDLVKELQAVLDSL